MESGSINSFVLGSFSFSIIFLRLLHSVTCISNISNCSFSLMRNNTLYGHTTIFLSINKHVACFQVIVLMNKAVINILVEYLFGPAFVSSWVYTEGVEF